MDRDNFVVGILKTYRKRQSHIIIFNDMVHIQNAFTVSIIKFIIALD